MAYQIVVDPYCSTYNRVAIRLEPQDQMASNVEEIYEALRKGKKFEKRSFDLQDIKKVNEDVLYLAAAGCVTDELATEGAKQEIVKQGIVKQRIRVVDTGTYSGGIGLLLDLAIKNRERGLSIEENARLIEDAAKTLRTYIVSSDIIYMKRNGLLSSAVSSCGLMINMKSIFTLENGELKSSNKIRGNKMIADYLLGKLEQDAMQHEIGSAHIFSGKADELKTVILSELMGRIPEVGTVTGELEAHPAALLGPGTLVMSWGLQ